MSENLHLDADFTINQQPDIQADFYLTVTQKIEGSELINIEKNLNTITLTSVNYTYEQGIASDTWVIEHNLNKMPSVIVVDSANTVQIPDDIIYDSNNQITIIFVAAFAGKAYLN